MQLRRNVVLWYRLVGLWIEKLDTLVLAQRVEELLAEGHGERQFFGGPRVLRE